MEVEDGMEEYISDDILEELCGTRDFSNVSSLEAVVNTSDSSVAQLGMKLPSLLRLKLSNSYLETIRDLGTSLSKLQVLWVSKCSLKDLEGVSSIPCLVELYCAYNDISDISPLSSLSRLQVLDIEGNNVKDVEQFGYIQFCSKLSSISLAGNPVTETPGFLRSLLRQLPGLLFVDDAPASEVGKSNSTSNAQEMRLLMEGIKGTPQSPQRQAYVPQVSAENARRRPFSARGRRPSSSEHLNITAQPPSYRPLSARPQASTLRQARWGGTALQSESEDSSSDLTFGSSSVFCGNPVRSLRSRRMNDKPDDRNEDFDAMLRRELEAVKLKDQTAVNHYTPELEELDDVDDGFIYEDRDDSDHVADFSPTMKNLAHDQNPRRSSSKSREKSRRRGGAMRKKLEGNYAEHGANTEEVVKQKSSKEPRRPPKYPPSNGVVVGRLRPRMTSRIKKSRIDPKESSLKKS